MLTVTGLWFDHERTPVGLDIPRVRLAAGRELPEHPPDAVPPASCPDPGFAALLYDEPVKPETPLRCTRRA